MRFEMKGIKKPGPEQWITQWLTSGIGLALITRWVNGVTLDARGSEAILTILGAAAVLGLLNILLKPLLILITLPINILSLGLFTLVINGMVLWAVARLVPSFHIETFGTAVWAALLLSLISLLIQAFTGSAQVRVDIHRRP